jgi:hypothetical protein
VVHIIFTTTNSSEAAPFIESQLWTADPKSGILSANSATKNMGINTNSNNITYIGNGKIGKKNADVTAAPTSTSTSTSTSSTHSGVSSLSGT